MAGKKKTRSVKGKVVSVSIEHYGGMHCDGGALTEVVLVVLRQDDLFAETDETLKLFAEAPLPLERGDLIRVEFQEKNGEIKKLEKIWWNDPTVVAFSYKSKDYH